MFCLVETDKERKMELISNKNEWTGKKNVAIRLTRILAGYVAAVLVATTIVLLPFGIFGAWGFGVWLFGICITAITAFFPMMLFVLFNETKHRFGPYGHMFSGAGVALVAHVIFQVFEASAMARHMDFSLVALSVVGGAVGALAYWKIAVAHLQNNPFRIDVRKVASVF
jgi:hypothetical protein